MEIFVVAALASGIIALAGMLLARNIRYKALATLNRSYASVVMIVLAVLLVCDLLAGKGALNRIPVDLMLALLPLSLFPNTFMTPSQKRVVILFSQSISALLSIYYILCFAGLCVVPGDVGLRIMAVVATLMHLFLSSWIIFFKIHNIHALMQTGTVWTVLCLSVDAIYAEVLLVLMTVYSAAVTLAGVCLTVALIMGAMLFALGLRMTEDSVLVLFRRHERRIVESMRISPIESIPSNPGEENVYKELFERIQEYFDEEKPFLNGNLTINDIVTEVFSNKVYISRAIVQCTGRNFCQYVNYHRIMYAMECFRQNTELKISELWPLCGFNTIVSFNMAFRLFMDENPSEWCRKEKIRLSKKKK